jgi:hypothetical protein
MSNESLSRRDLLKGALVGIAAGSAASLVSQVANAAPPMLTEAEGKAMGYVVDAAKVDAKSKPTYKVGQTCANCALYQGKPGDAAGPCAIFPGKHVAAKGWCQVWAKKA